MTVKVFAKPTLAGIVNANVVVTSGASFVTVPVGVVGIGGVLEWATATADIGDTPYATDGTKTILLKNTGTADATVTGFTTKYESSPFSASPNSFTILARDSSAVTLKLARGSTTVSPLSDELKPKAAGLCMAAPPKVTVTGRRVNNTVTVSGADWGMRDCNSTTSDRGNVLVRNYSFAALTWSLKTPLPTIYKLAPGALVNLGFTAPSTADSRATLTPTRNGGGTICNPAALTVVNMTGKLP